MCEDNFLQYFEIDGDYLDETTKIYDWISCEVGKYKKECCLY